MPYLIIPLSLAVVAFFIFFPMVAVAIIAAYIVVYIAGEIYAGFKESR